MKNIKNLLFSLLILSLFSCSESETDKSIRDMVFDQNNIQTGNNLPTENVLSFNPANLNFGTVQNNTTNTRQITISNAFGFPVNVTVTHTNNVNTLSYSPSVFQIPANGSYVLNVTYTPTGTSFLTATMRFTYPANMSNSTGPITQNVSVSGNSVANLSTSLVVSPTGTIDFGTLVQGMTATRNITLTNNGDVTANWNTNNLNITCTPSSGSIPAGGSQQVAMVFTATGTGVYNNTQTFSFNGGTVQVPYTVNRVAATRIIGVTCTTSTAFGNVQVNTTATKTVVISNTGNSPLTVSSITVQSTPSNQFTCAYSGVIAPNASVQVPINFRPTSTGSKSGQIIVQSNRTSGTNNLSFSGSGI
jgi:Abnormal spindle-like microcephaly-assoc'd, ASPM-SPD-2-Hydin